MCRVQQYHLLHELDLIEAFGFCLHQDIPEWNISHLAITRTPEGVQHPLFVLYRHGVSIGAYRSAVEALVQIGNDALTSDFYS